MGAIVMLRSVVMAFVGWALFGTGAIAQDIAVGVRYKQSAAVLARYPDLSQRLDTPALVAGRQTLTTQAEMEAYLAGLVKPGAPMALATLGQTQQGRALPILYFSKEGSADPAALRATGRPIVWLIGQQHGNEPAGGEAMLAVAKALAEGELRALLETLTVVVVPRANPDGAAAEKRDTAAGMDMNRDHASLTLPEVRALHREIQALPPDLIIDAHEFSVAARWIEKFGALQAVDLMLLSGTHPMIPDATRAMAQTVFEPAIVAAAAAQGLKSFTYHTTTTRRDDNAVSMGGNAAGIARNAFGLMGAVSILLETRGVGVGMESYQRRVATHYIAVKAALEAAAHEGAKLRAAVIEARRALAADTRALIVAHKVGSEAVDVPMIDPETGVEKLVKVQFSNSRRVTITEQRERPMGYVLLPGAFDALDELALMGAKTCRLSVPAEIDAEVFSVTDRGRTNRRAINPDQSVKGQMERRRVAVPAGAVIVALDQPAAARLSAALEPDAPGGFLGLDVVTLGADQTEVPILRLMRGATVTAGGRGSDGVESCAVAGK
jgi:Zinc carboxypeptidase